VSPRLTLAGLLACLVAGLAQAQDPYPANKAARLGPEPTFPQPVRLDQPTERWVFKFAPLVALDIDPSIMVGAEYMLGPRWSLQGELGYGYYGLWQQLSEENPNPVSALRTRLDVRRYFVKDRPAPRGGYLALDLFFKQASQWREAVEDLGPFQQVSDFRRVRRVPGGHFKIGWQVGDKVLFDFFVGLGARVIFVRTPGRPDTVPNNEFWGSLFTSNFGDYLMPSLAMGFKVGLPWKGNK
jgi:hypothetical protein